ncbi:MAG: hypothetical protein MUF54_22030 [Polyangiaceae bacterium]|nr:hypothetical protein [Polyangiaceae bacterium]
MVEVCVDIFGFDGSQVDAALLKVAEELAHLPASTPTGGFHAAVTLAGFDVFVEHCVISARRWSRLWSEPSKKAEEPGRREPKLVLMPAHLCGLPLGNAATRPRLRQLLTVLRGPRLV